MVVGTDMQATRPVLYDVFCGAGGATKGYQSVGFYVIGVDDRPQPNYCGDEFLQMDAFEFFAGYLRGEYRRADAFHASPPCQPNLRGLNAVNRARGRGERKRPDLIAATRERLRAAGAPYVIENVVGAALENPVRLCGSSFGLQVRRHRLFESNVLLLAPPCDHTIWREAKYPTNFRPGGRIVMSRVVQVYGNTAGSHLWPAAMGIDWMNRAELMEAIPPVYSEHVGRQIAAYLTAARAAA